MGKSKTAGRVTSRAKLDQPRPASAYWMYRVRRAREALIRGPVRSQPPLEWGSSDA